MKKLIGLLLVFNMCLIMVAGSLMYLAETYPFHPGHVLYGLQDIAEQGRLRLSTDLGQQAEFALALADRRLTDLALAKNHRQIDSAAVAFDQALNQSILRIDAAPQDAQAVLYERLEVLLNQADVVVAAIEPTEDCLLITELNTKVTSLLAAEDSDDLQALIPTTPEVPLSIPSEVISFLGQDVEHQDFPLQGGHAEIECLSCHTDGSYANTPTECSHCHNMPGTDVAQLRYNANYLFASKMYSSHFPGECSDCHGIADWKPIAFDHEGVYECSSCHAEDIPLVTSVPDAPAMVPISFMPDVTYAADKNNPHYAGDCMDCHTNTLAWEDATFDHSEVEECTSCHLYDVSSDHYPGVCADCHQDTADWQEARVIHTHEYQDCISCHLEERPLQHYRGQCASCHTTEGWSPAYFNHTAYSGATDCRSCHQKPTKHYTGQCSNCHNVMAWGDVRFNHTGQTNCQKCHAAPENHYDGSCRDCHTTRSWRKSIFDHYGVINCLSCHSTEAPSQHYLENCADCHNNNNWAEADYDHVNSIDCLACHSVPSNHYPGACSSCHNTNNWANISYIHSGDSDCLACHTTPAGHYTTRCTTCHNVTSWTEGTVQHSSNSDCMACHAAPTGHYIGQCSFCHNTDNWQQYTFDHTGLVDCWSCHTPPTEHYPGQCSNCHIVQNWIEINFDHSGYDNCTGCHAPPEGHWPGQCSNCHVTSAWTEVHFDHTGYVNCKSCHVRPNDENHRARGQCSTCHTTESWIINPTPTPTAEGGLTSTDAMSAPSSRPLAIPTITPPPDRRDATDTVVSDSNNPPDSRIP